MRRVHGLGCRDSVKFIGNLISNVTVVRDEYFKGDKVMRILFK
jgi:hypothetical protein